MYCNINNEIAEISVVGSVPVFDKWGSPKFRYVRNQIQGSKTRVVKTIATHFLRGINTWDRLKTITNKLLQLPVNINILNLLAETLH